MVNPTRSRLLFDKPLIWLDLSQVKDKAAVKALGGLTTTDTFDVTVRGIFTSEGYYGHRNRYAFQIVARELSERLRSHQRKSSAR